MNFVNVSLDAEEEKTRILRTQVRVKAVMEALLANTDEVHTHSTIFKFLQRITTSIKFWPEDYFSPLEKSRLKFDQHGRPM